MKRISVLVPCYNEEENIPLFWQELRRVFTASLNKQYELELLYIDDGSSDGTLDAIRGLAAQSEGGG